MAEIDEFLRPFAEAIYAKVDGFRKLKATLTRQQRARLLAAISDDIKQCSNFLPPFVSQAAFDEAAKSNVDLRSKNWHDQPKFDRDRKKYHWEHIVPVVSVRDRCLDAKSAIEVFEILTKVVRVAWVLKMEDNELTRLGFRHKRPDPDAAYLQAKIVLVDITRQQE